MEVLLHNEASSGEPAVGALHRPYNRELCGEISLFPRLGSLRGHISPRISDAGIAIESRGVRRR